VFEAVVEVEGLKCWASEVMEGRRASMTVLECRASEGGRSVQNWVEVTAEPQDVPSLAQEIRRHPQVVRTDLAMLRSGLVGLVKTKWCPVWSALKGQTCAVRQHRLAPDGTSRLTIMVSGREALGRLVEELSGSGARVKVLRLSGAVGEAPLTPRQLRVLSEAIEKGYYDYPRRIRQRELAASCGLSSSALSELLRRAERNLLKWYEGKAGPGTAGPRAGSGQRLNHRNA